MCSAVLVRIAKISNMVAAACLAAFGAFMIVEPTCSENVLRFTLGAIVALSGICKLIGYFSKDLYRLAFQYDLPLGIVFAVSGTVLLFCSQDVVPTSCILFGAAVLIEGVFKIKTSIDAKKFGIRWWFLLFALAIFACILGGALLCRPSDDQQVLLLLLGICCIENGLLHFMEKMCTVKVIKNRRKVRQDAQE